MEWIILFWITLALLAVATVVNYRNKKRLTEIEHRVDVIETKRKPPTPHGVAMDMGASLTSQPAEITAPSHNGIILDPFTPIDAELMTYDVNKDEMVSAMIHVRIGSITRVVPTIVLKALDFQMCRYGNIQHVNIWSNIAEAFKLFLDKNPNHSMIAMVWTGDGCMTIQDTVTRPYFGKYNDVILPAYLLSSEGTEGNKTFTLRPFTVTFPYRSNYVMIGQYLQDLLDPNGTIINFNLSGFPQSVQTIMNAMNSAKDAGYQLVYSIYSDNFANTIKLIPEEEEPHERERE